MKAISRIAIARTSKQVQDTRIKTKVIKDKSRVLFVLMVFIICGIPSSTPAANPIQLIISENSINEGCIQLINYLDLAIAKIKENLVWIESSLTQHGS